MPEALDPAKPPKALRERAAALSQSRRLALERHLNHRRSVCPVEQAQYDEITRSVKTGIEDLHAKIDKVDGKLAEQQKQLDAIDIRIAEPHGSGGFGHKSLAEHLKENDQVARLIHDHRGRAVVTIEGEMLRSLERKTTITSTAVGSQTTGV